MFTKENIKGMMADNEGKTFVISTNVATGLGINGTSYDKFMSYRRTSKRGCGHDENDYTETRIEVKDITDDMLVLRESVEKYTLERYNGITRQRGKRLWSASMIYLPFSTIQHISFIEPESEFFNGFMDRECFIDATENN